MTTVEQIKAARKAGVTAAMSVAQDIAEGKVDTGQLDAAVAAECRTLFARVEGPGDPLWELQVDVARQVLAVGGGVSSVELAEWTAVYRQAEGSEAAPAASWIEDALAQYDAADELVEVTEDLGLYDHGV